MATRLWVGGSAEDWAGEGYQFGSRTLLSGGGPGRTVPLYDVDTDEQLTDLLDRDGNPVTAATSHDAIGHWGPVQLPEGVPSARVGPNRTLVIGRSTRTGSDAAAAKQARDEAEAFSATTQELQDTAVSTLMGTPGTQTETLLSAMLASKVDLISDVPAPIYVAHRGGHLIYPEHSMEGYRAAFRSGFPVEPDVRPLADGTLVCCHDATVDRTMDGTGNVSSFTLDQWLAMRIDPQVMGAATAIPVTWEHVLNELGGRALLMPEVKVTAARQPLIDSIKARGLERAVIVQSFNYADVAASAAAGIASLYLSDTVGAGGSNPTFNDLLAAGIDFLGCGPGASDAYIAAASAAGLRVIVYTINSKAEAAQKFAAGADGVFSDDPWHLSGRYVARDTDPMRERLLPWPHMVGRYLNQWWFAAPNKLRRGVYDPSAGTSSLSLDWAGVRSPNVRVTFTVDYLETATAQTRWIGIAYGAFSSDDAYFIDAVTSGQNVYHFLQRRNGTLAAYKVLSGAAAESIGTTAGTEVAAEGARATHRMQMEISATGVTWKNLTTGATLTVADTALRSPGRLTLTANGTLADFYDFVVEDL